jgi:two-component system sensor histidine kinase CreC
VYKDRIDTAVYITDRNGTVVYDSSGEHKGDDFSLWRDVKLTLEGEYGARTSFIDEDHTEEDDPRILVIAAPIHFQNEIVGVVSVVKPLQILDAFLLSQSYQLKKYAVGLLALAMFLGYLVSYSFTRAIEKLARYADEMATGKKVTSPTFMDKRFVNLAQAISRLRHELDGKQYVEDYVHSLTHELKTPITSVQAAAELLQEDLPAEQRQQFIDNIQNANKRMSRLVERMLELAKLEGLPPLQTSAEFDLTKSIGQLLDERSALITARKIKVSVLGNRLVIARGDPLLIQQAIANLLDNALHYGRAGSEVQIHYGEVDQAYSVEVINKDQELDPLIIERAFERFFSMPLNQEISKSTGLGLSFVREIMKLHGGTAVLSNIPEGVQAKICWPVRNQN